MAALNASRSRTKVAGFTLVELVVVMVIVGILVAIAQPPMRALILAQYVRSAASDLRSAMNFARSEAIKRAANVSVVPGGGSWLNGWTVQDAGGVVLRRQNALSDQLVLPVVSDASTVTYRSDGRITAAHGDVVFATSNSSVTARCVSIDLGGRPTVLFDTDSNPVNGCN